MPRQARLKLAGEPWHVYQRGVNRCRCFGNDADRRIYLSLLGEHAARHGCAVHAYVLMSNHVHLLVTPAEDTSISRMMKGIGERYVRIFNRRHKRTGTLWEGRFRSTIAECDRYLLTLYKYIELNPVRARMVAHPSQFFWSSYRSNADGDHSPIVTPHPFYLKMGPDSESRRARYRQLFEAPISEEDIMAIRQAAMGGFALGGPVHQCRVETNAGRRAQRVRRSTGANPESPPPIP